MKIGVTLEAQEGIGWDEWRRTVGWVEELGFESLWRSDHFTSLEGRRDLESLETFVSLTYAATATARIVLGTLVSPLTFRHPALIARMAAAIHELANGRFVLGLGAGWYEPEHVAFGIPFPAPKLRARALCEGAAVIRALLSGERVAFDGAVFRLEDAAIAPAGPVPILIGGLGKRGTLPAVARYADEWNVPGIPVARYREKVEALVRECERVRRDPHTIRRSIVFTHALASTEREARALFRDMVAATPPRYRPGSGPDAPAWLVGTPERVVEQLEELKGEGVDRVMFQFRRPPAREQLELIAAEVVPKVSHPDHVE